MNSLRRPSTKGDVMLSGQDDTEDHEGTEGDHEAEDHHETAGPPDAPLFNRDADSTTIYHRPISMAPAAPADLAGCDPDDEVTSTTEISTARLETLLDGIRPVEEFQKPFTAGEIASGLVALEASIDDNASATPTEAKARRAIAPARASAHSEEVPLDLVSDLYGKRPENDSAPKLNTQPLHLVPTHAPALHVPESKGEVIPPRDASQTHAEGRLEDLVLRSQRATGRARASLLADAAEIARTELSDLPRATELYSEALEFAPADDALVAAAEVTFEEAGRRRELTDKLVGLTADATDKSTWLFLQRKVAARCAADSDIEGAIGAHRALLAIAKEPDAMRALITLLRRTQGRDAEVAQALEELADLVDAAEARDLRFDRALLLVQKVGDLEAAKETLRTLLKAQAGRDRAAIELLAQLGSQTEDPACLAEAREQELALAASDAERTRLTRSLADLYEGALTDPGKAIASLDLWASLEPGNPEPYLRLVPLLEQRKRFAELRSVCDTLGGLSIDEKDASAAVLRASELSMNELGDHEGAWRRLVPRVVDASDLAAEAMLRDLAAISGRGEHLAELFVGLAQRAADEKTQTRRWMDAADAYEKLAGSRGKALEAALRALANQMTNRALLDEVDRLAAAAGAWPRLSQVYDALARRGETVEERTGALLRHAALLEHGAHDLPQAFERVALAFSLAPDADEIYAEAERLGRACGRIEELIAIHERRAIDAGDTDRKIDALIEVCRLAQQALEDAPRATGSLARAVALAAERVEALDRIEQVVKQLDENQPPLDRRGLTRALCEVYAQRAQDEGVDVEFAILLLQRAAVLLDVEQHDLRAAYRALARAATLASSDESLLDALVALATRASEHEALARHLQQAADDALDSATASIALRRLSVLYEGDLASPAKAARVFRQLVMLNPDDIGVADRLRASLRAAGEFEELLAAIERQLSLVTSPAARVPLLEEAALTWETDLNNRFEARDAWEKVLSLDPGHPGALEAIQRLGAKAGMSEHDLLEGDLVVGPEDLRPSVPPYMPGPKEPQPMAERV